MERRRMMLVIVMCQLFVLCLGSDSSVDITTRLQCVTGWTGEDSGGSCTFNHNYCDWQNAFQHIEDWLRKAGELVFDSSEADKGSKASLKSPVICERPNGTSCLGFRYRFSSGGGTKFYVKVCSDEDNKCTRIFEEEFKDDDTDWHDVRLQFNPSEQFLIYLVGEKYKSNWIYDESDIFIDYVTYNNVPCESVVTQVIPLATTNGDSLWPMTGTFTTAVDVSSLQSRDKDGTNDWTTDVTAALLTSTLAVEQAGTGRGGNQSSFEESSKDNEDNDNNKIIIISSVCGGILLLLIVTGLVVFLVVSRKRRAQSSKDSAHDRNDSLVMVSNQMYYSMDTARSVSSPDDAIALTDYQPASAPSESPQSTKEQTEDTCYSSIDESTSAPTGREATAENAQTKEATSRTTENGHYENHTDDQVVYENTIGSDIGTQAPTEGGMKGVGPGEDGYSKLHDRSITRKPATDTYDHVVN